MKIAKIVDFDYNNGDGVRVSLWTTGCPHKCKGCHNEHLWDSNIGKEFTKEDMLELLDLLEKDISKDLSILGGEPLAPYNVDRITDICKIVKEVFPTKSMWLWTGYEYDEIKDLEVMDYLDVVIVGKFEEDKKDIKLKWMGSSNQQLIDLKSIRNVDQELLNFLQKTSNFSKVEFTYKNWKGKTSKRIVIPLEIYTGSTEYHTDRQWLLKAYDVVKKEVRDFAIKDIIK